MAMTIEDIKESIGEEIDEIDNVLFMAEGPTSHLISKEIHLEGCIGQLKSLKNNLETLIENI